MYLDETAGSAVATGFESDSAALGSYLNKIGRVPLLDADGEADLARAARAGDESAAKRLVEANLRLVVHFASRYSRRGVPLRDLIAEGNFGLMRAVRTYEARPGGRFANYAVWWIRRHILRCLSDSERSIRMPVHRAPALAAIHKARIEYAEKNGRDPSAEEIAGLTGIPLAKVIPLLISGRRALSLQAPVSPGESDGGSFGDLIADENAESPSEVCSRDASKSDLLRLVTTLPAREAEIVRARFGLEDGEERTCEEIGRRYGLTRERVRQIQDVAMRKLRRAYEDIDRRHSKEEILEAKKAKGRDVVLAEFARANRKAKAKDSLLREGLVPDPVARLAA